MVITVVAGFWVESWTLPGFTQAVVCASSLMRDPEPVPLNGAVMSNWHVLLQVL